MHNSQTSNISSAVDIFKTPFIKLRNFSTTYSNECAAHLTEQRSKALVVDGQTLVFALKQTCSKLFLTLAKECSTVLCCRATPLQKVWYRYCPLYFMRSFYSWIHPSVLSLSNFISPFDLLCIHL